MKTWKQLFRTMLFACAAAVLLAAQATAAEIVHSGTCGPDLKWTMDENGLLSISGTGGMEDIPWWHYWEEITEISLDSGVTSIAPQAFNACRKITTLTIPDGVTTIGMSAIQLCDNLEKLIIPASVQTLGYDWNNDVCGGVFWNNAKITTAGPIGSGSNLEFGWTNSIPDGAFWCSSISSIILPESITEIGKEAFLGCGNLSTVTLPPNIRSIETCTFQHCYKLTTISIPATVEYIGSYAFEECGALVDVYFGGTQEQWDSIDVLWGNDVLSTATIHYGDYRWTPSEPPHQSEPKEQLALSFNFPNTPTAFGYPQKGYRIPLSRYIFLYGNTALAKQMYAADYRPEGWGGNCYGMDTTSGLFSTPENGINVSDFRSGASRPGDLSVSDKNTGWNLTLKEFIEVMQIAQKSSTFCAAYSQNLGRLTELCGAVSSYQDSGGGPVVICVYGTANGKPGGHALLGYRLEEIDSTQGRLYVYDPNFPNDNNRYLTLTKSRGSYTGWSYLANDKYQWGSSYGGKITFIPYEAYLADWNNRGRVEYSMVLLSLDVASADIYDVEGNPVASFRDGEMTTNRSDVYPVVDLDFPDTGSPSDRSGLSVWLPVNDVYEVRNRESAGGQYEASIVNLQYAASVTTTASSVLLSAEDSTSSSFVQINEPNRRYDVTLTSPSGEYQDVRLSGTTAYGKALSLMAKSGSLDISGAEDTASLHINGVAVSLGTLSQANETTRGRFDDVHSSDYFYTAVDWAVSQGITKGTTATTFSPHEKCTRSHIITFLWRANGSPEPVSSANPFTDVPAGSYYEKAARWAYEKGLENGRAFNGDTLCTRATAVTYFWKLAGSPTAVQSSFSDVPFNASYARAVDWAVECGITKGTSETTFSPETVCSRAQIVTFLHRSQSL